MEKKVVVVQSREHKELQSSGWKPCSAWQTFRREKKYVKPPKNEPLFWKLRRLFGRYFLKRYDYYFALKEISTLMVVMEKNEYY